VYSYFPTGVTNDGKMLCIAGENLNTLSGTSVTVSFSVDNTESQFNLGFFDGMSNSTWDMYTNAFPTTYTLYADPYGDGTGTTVIATWTDTNMSDNSWTDFPINTSAAARAPSGNYFYRLTVNATNPTINSLNAFKVRVTGYTYIIPTTVFGYIGAFPDPETLVYPNYPTRTPTTYDGTWNFYMNIAENSSYVDMWDGDFDLTNDTDDPNTSFIPPFDSGAGVLDGARPGSPVDDNANLDYLRTPNVRYSIILPDGTTSYANTNPSGNTEWELFRLDTTTNNPTITDYQVPALPSGLYNVQVTGVDMHNLNALRFEHPVIGVDVTGRPMIPPAPFVVGDRVFNDIDGDGVQDVGEPGVPGVVLTLRDTVSGRIITAATTDANGDYGLVSWNGTYQVYVDDSNYMPGGALQGMVPTNPDPANATVTVSTANISTVDFGFMTPPLVGLNVTPDQAGSMAPGHTIEYTYTVSNATSTPGTFNVSAVSSQGWSTAVLDSGGSPITQVVLGANESVTVRVRTAVPITATNGMQDTTTLRATLSTDPLVSDSARGVTTVRTGLMITPDLAETGSIGTTITYRHTVTNSWPIARTINLAAVSSRGWPIAIFAADGVTPITQILVGPNGAAEEIVVKVTIPTSATTGQQDVTTVSATYPPDSASDSAADTTTARRLMTYTSGTYVDPETVFVRGAQVYARAGGLPAGTFRFRWYDSANTLVRTGPQGTSSGGVYTDSYPTTVASPLGAWRAVIQRRVSGNWSDYDNTPFQVVGDAEISHLWATDAPQVNTDVSVGSALQNQMTEPIINSSITYVIWWDQNGDGVFSAGDLWIDSTGHSQTWNGSASVSTHVSTGVDVAGTSTYTDPPWQINNVDFPNQGTYNVNAVWTDSTGGVIDAKTTQFYSIPTLTWPVFAAVLGVFAFVMSRRLRLAPAVAWAGERR